MFIIHVYGTFDVLLITIINIKLFSRIAYVSIYVVNMNKSSTIRDKNMLLALRLVFAKTFEKKEQKYCNRIIIR